MIQICNYSKSEDGIDTSDTGQLKAQFNMDVNGSIQPVSAAFERTLKPIEFTRKEKEIAMTAEDLQKYSGEYDLSDTSVKVYTKGNIFYVSVQGQPDYELTPPGGDKVNIKS